MKAKETKAKLTPSFSVSAFNRFNATERSFTLLMPRHTSLLGEIKLKTPLKEEQLPICP
jgi:hypothetical protein